MTYRDLISVSPTPLANVSASPQFRDVGEELRIAKPTVLWALLHKRWWALGLIVLLAGGIGYLVATEFGRASANVSASLIYTGLPIPPGPQVYKAPSLQTYKEILFSNSSMQQIANQHGLEVPPDLLGGLFNLKITPDSSVMHLSLEWEDPEDGVAIVNDTVEMLIDQAAERRRQVLQEHMKHVELSQLDAKRQVDEAGEQLRSARRRYEDAIRTGGLATERYTSVLDKVTTAHAAIDAKNVEKAGMMQQMERIATQQAEAALKYKELILEACFSKLNELGRSYAKNSQRFQELQKLHENLVAFKSRNVESFEDWEKELVTLTTDELGSLQELSTPAMVDLKSAIRTYADSIYKRQLDLIPVDNQLGLLERRLAEYEKEAVTEAGDVALASSVEVADYEKAMEEAEGRLKVVAAQLENMKQLEQCRSREFSVLVPASLQTVTLDSNKKKLFVLAFLAAGLVLTSPLVLAEWLSQRDHPVMAFSRKWCLPVIAERVLDQYKARTDPSSHWHRDESIRMAALRIQQALPRSPSVVLVSSLGKSPTPAQVLTCIADCLAHRGERVLIVDAMDPREHRTNLQSVAARVPEPELSPCAKKLLRQARENGDSGKEVTPRPGLSDYFSSDCQITADLVQPTKNPNVDLITSGSGEFPVEAMASKCLTELLDYCRDTYSLIIVGGPSASNRADFQMLAARADGIVLTADRAAVKEPSSAIVIQDLIELRAPVVGVIA